MIILTSGPLSSSWGKVEQLMIGRARSVLSNGARLIVASACFLFIAMSLLFLQACGDDKVSQGSEGTDHRIEASSYEALTTPNGIPRKAIVTKRKAFAYERRDFSGPAAPLRFFRKYFIFEETGQGYLLGEATARASLVGWTKREDVMPWNTEQAIFFINKKAQDRVPVRIWHSREDIGNNDAPLFEERLNRRQTSEPFPILEKQGSLVKVAFLWDAGGPIQILPKDLSEGNGDDVIADLLEGEKVSRETTGKRIDDVADWKGRLREEAKRMDIVLVMDVTRSMRPYMERVRASMVGIIYALTDIGVKDVDIHIGLVAYRDFADEGFSFVTKALNLTQDRGRVIRFLNELTPDSVGLAKNEAVFDGLNAAARTMSWGRHSYRVICLVGDAPPHTAHDSDTKMLRDTGRIPRSDFFGKDLDENIQRIRNVVQDERIQLYALGVGEDSEMKDAFSRIVAREERFLSLTDAQAFIAALESELKKTKITRDETQDHLEQAMDSERPLSSLTDSELESLRILNVDPRHLKEMSKNLIQTGWFEPKVGDDSVVCVYVRRHDLEMWMQRLLVNLPDFNEKELAIMGDIVDFNAGPGAPGNTIEDLTTTIADLPFRPPIFDDEVLMGSADAKVAALHKKVINLQILLLTEQLFSEEYEEGWAPMDYLPGSLAEFRAPR